MSTGKKIWNGWTWLNDGMLCLLLTSLIILACVQISLRIFFSGGLLWADTLIRYLVLWTGLLGAVVATREGKHIAIDVVTYLAPEKTKLPIRLFLNTVSFFIAAILTWAAVIFVRNEVQFGSSKLLGIPSWGWNLIFPIAFGLIAFHFFIGLAIDIFQLFGFKIDQSTGRGEDPHGQ